MQNIHTNGEFFFHSLLINVRKKQSPRTYINLGPQFQKVCRKSSILLWTLTLQIQLISVIPVQHSKPFFFHIIVAMCIYLKYTQLHWTHFRLHIAYYFGRTGFCRRSAGFFRLGCGCCFTREVWRFLWSELHRRRFLGGGFSEWFFLGRFFFL